MDTIEKIAYVMIIVGVTMIAIGIYIGPQQEKTHMRSQGMEWRKAGWYRVDETTQSLTIGGPQ